MKLKQYDNNGLRCLLPTDLVVEADGSGIFTETRDQNTSFDIKALFDQDSVDSVKSMIIDSNCVSDEIRQMQDIRKGTFEGVFSGIERVMAIKFAHDDSEDYSWQLLLTVDRIPVSFNIYSKGCFENDEPMWLKIIESLEVDGPKLCQAYKLESGNVGVLEPLEDKLPTVKELGGAWLRVPHELQYLVIPALKIHVLTIVDGVEPEDIDIPFVENAVEKETDGFSEDELNDRVENDYELLKSWLDDLSEEDGNSVLAFRVIEGVLLFLMLKDK